MDATVSIFATVTDKHALWDAAAALAVSNHTHETRSDYKKEFGIDAVTTHLRFLLDRGVLPNSGFEINDSICTLDTNPVDDSPATALTAAYQVLAAHPGTGTRDEALDTLISARAILRAALDILGGDDAGEVAERIRSTYRELTTDTAGLPADDANSLIKQVADQLRPIADQKNVVADSEYAHLGEPPEVLEGQSLFIARQERDAIVTYEAYIVAEDADEAKSLADADQCEWIASGTGDLDDRTITVEPVAAAAA